ncbi:MAG: YlbF family regulator [Lachnospiraceae bacterium]|nr:YlbF family regulator [Lachnospiraceae bacterium]MDE6253746.1 YlbF family regulator [Lachnospiraceae bacterium]
MEKDETKPDDTSYYYGSRLVTSAERRDFEMFELESKAREVAELLLNSEVYIKYDEARRKLEENSELLLGVNEYRKKRFYIQNNPDENMQNALNQLVIDYGHIVNNPTAMEYMDAESLLCREVRKVTAIIADVINMDMNFLD